MPTPRPSRGRPISDQTYASAVPAPADEGKPADLCAPSDAPLGHLTKPPSTNLLLPRSPLIGREHEVAAVQDRLLQEQVSLLTLTGPGGVGKTRLALQVASNLLDHFIDGVSFVSLASIREPNLVLTAIAQILGVRESAGRALQESLQDYLRDKQLLLVLDNFEQVVTAAPLVGALLIACRRLKVLVTSRATLHLYGEQEFPVPPLALPDGKRLAILEKTPESNVTQSAAIELFCQRASAVKPDFVLIPDNAADVARICISLDGLPLAIELAAARLKLFSPLALLARLQQRLTLLTGGPHDLPARQRTLRDEIAWSYDLLTADEQTLFRRLAVFVGGFTLEAAQAVGNVNKDLAVDVLDGVATLVNQNLLKQMEPSGGEPRFSMLETIHEYGLEQLAASDEAEAIRRYHAIFFLALAETTEPELLGPYRERVLVRLEAELDNLRSALVWSESDLNRTEIGLRLAGALTWFAHFSNRFSEARGWLVTSLQRTTEPTAARAKALWGAGLMAIIQGDFLSARTALETSKTLWCNIGDQRGLAIALRELCLVQNAQRQFVATQQYGGESVALLRAVDSQWHLALALDNLGIAVANQGDQMRARLLFQEELALFRVVDDAWGLSGAMISLGFIASQQGDYSTACPLLEESLTIRRTLADKWMITNSLNLLGEVRQQQGELEHASNLYHECLVLANEIGDKACVAHILHHLGTLAQSQTQHERAVRLFAVAAALREVVGGFTFHTLVDPVEQERSIAAMRTLIGEEIFATTWVQGQALTLEQAIAYALTPPSTPEAVTAADPTKSVESPLLTFPAGLTAREVEVLRLVVQGLPYAEIADKLVISRRTVNAHVTSIFSKLGVTTRAAATRFAIDYHLV